jgi:hypothetical protein
MLGRPFALQFTWLINGDVYTFLDKWLAYVSIRYEVTPGLPEPHYYVALDENSVVQKEVSSTDYFAILAAIASLHPLPIVQFTDDGSGPAPGYEDSFSMPIDRVRNLLDDGATQYVETAQSFYQPTSSQYLTIFQLLTSCHQLASSQGLES